MVFYFVTIALCPFSVSTAKGQSFRGFFPGLNDIWHRKQKVEIERKKESETPNCDFFLISFNLLQLYKMSNRQPSCSGSADMRPEMENVTRWLLLVLTPRCWESDFFFTVRDVAHVKNLSSWLNIQSFCKVRNHILACNLSPLEHISHYWKRLCCKQRKPSLLTLLLTK